MFGFSDIDDFTLFYFVGLYLAFAGAVWSLLISHFGRKHDALGTFFISRIPYAVIAVISVMTGLAAPHIYTEATVQYAHYFFPGALLGVFAITLRLKIAKDIPIGILTTITAVCFVFSVLVYEYVFMVTFPNIVQLGLIVLITIGTLILVRLRNHHESLFNALSPGLFLAAVAVGACNGLSLAILGDVARAVDPFIAAVTYNLIMGGILLLLLTGRWCVTGRGLDHYPVENLSGILMIGVVGFSFTLAIGIGSRLGSFSLLTAIESSAIALAAILSWLFLGEKLTGRQWGAILFITACVAALKFTG